MRFPMKKPSLLAAAFLACALGIGEAAAPLSLAESLDMALATHEDIAAAKASRDEARWELSAARRSTGFNARWQSGAVRIGGEYYETPRRLYDIRNATAEDDFWNWLGNLIYGAQTDPYNRTFSNTGYLSIPIYTGGKLENQIARQRHGLYAEDLTLENVRQSVRFKTLQAYYNLLQQENLRNISQSAVDMASEQRDLIQVQYEEGAAAYADVLQMKVQLANYRQGLVSAEGSLEAARYTLARIVGLPQDTPIEPTDDFTYTSYPFTMQECEIYALTHRADGAAAEFRIRQAEAGKNAQKAEWQPTIQAMAYKTITSDKPFSKERSERWSVGLQLSWAVFDNGVTSAKVDMAKAQENEARASAENLRSNILLETRTAYAEMMAAEKNIRTTERAVRQAEGSLMMAKARYEEGVGILLGVTKAQEKLNQARSNYTSALYQYNLGRAKLEKAMGVPVAIDVPLYREAAEEGKSAAQALRESAIPVAGEEIRERQQSEYEKPPQDLDPQ